jgi:predicted nucleic-acid-binding protein
MSHADRFLDTSVIVRYLTGDPANLAVLAQRIVDGEVALTVTDVVLTETVYVLTSVYRVPREIVVDRVVGLVSKKNIVVFALDKDTVIHGLLMCRRSGRVSVADAMIWAATRTAGATRIFTFDQRFPSEGMELREAP